MAQGAIELLLELLRELRVFLAAVKKGAKCRSDPFAKCGGEWAIL